MNQFQHKITSQQGQSNLLFAIRPSVSFWQFEGGPSQFLVDPSLFNKSTGPNEGYFRDLFAQSSSSDFHPLSLSTPCLWTDNRKKSLAHMML